MNCVRLGEFEVGYDTGSGPIWDYVCPVCLPEACRLLSNQIREWQQNDVENHPSCAHVSALPDGDRARCQFDFDDQRGSRYNPDMPREAGITQPLPPPPRVPALLHFEQASGVTICGAADPGSITGMLNMVTCPECRRIIAERAKT